MRNSAHNTSNILKTDFVGEDDGGGDDGIIFTEKPSPILHAPRDNISRKDNPSLRHNIYIYIYIYIGVRDCPYGICCPWVHGGWDLDALGKFFCATVAAAAVAHS